MKKNDLYSLGFLDSAVIASFREVINASAIFTEHEDYKPIFNLICVFMDRIDSSVRYLNNYMDMPGSEEDFINFLVYAAILRDGVKTLFENVFHKEPPCIGEKRYFSNAMYHNKPFFNEDTCPTDDDFFEYLRAMAFAHPYEVSGRQRNRPYMQSGEKHYCPWVIVGNSLKAFSGFKDAVGVRVYSSIDEEGITDITISFSALKAYIKSRYDGIEELTKWAEAGIEKQTEEWKQVKVNRNQQPAEILQEIIEILKERFENAFSIETALMYLNCPLSDERNEKNVAIFREAIIRTVPTICDCVDSLDYAGMGRAISIVFSQPQRMHAMAHYQLEKIYSYLDFRSKTIDPFSNEYWGLRQAYAFSQGFAKKWVMIDVVNMPYDEIKLLVRVACYLEAEEQAAQT